MLYSAKTRILLGTLLFLGISSAKATDTAAVSALSGARPNIVIIFIDDMGYGDIGPFGSTKNKTPNLDRMCSEGMKLTSFYAAPVCSASRAQLLTGCYAPRVSVPGVFFPAGPKGLHPDELTIADYLSKLGYATGCFGKWHLGDQVDFLPTRQGFDTYFGLPYSNDMGRVAEDSGKKVHPLVRDEKVESLIEDEQQRLITRQYTEEAINFIDENKDQPFFVYLPHTAMHVPLYPHPDFVGSSENGTYGDWISEVDWSVGQVLEALKQRNLADNTLVLFTSDNGPWASRGDAGGEAGPLRGSKGGTLEGGVREPTIAWWPGKIHAGGSSDAVAGTIDLLPTCVQLAGGELDASRKIDGQSILALLTGEIDQSPHDAWYYYKGMDLKAVRAGKWKLALGPQSIGMGFRDQPEDIVQKGLRLYDLDKDIGETNNVAEQNPDVVARLRQLADKMQADIGSGKAGPGVRPAGSVESPVTLYPTAASKKPAGKSSRRPVRSLEWPTKDRWKVIVSKDAPAVAGNAFTITATISDGSSEGVIVSHGGNVVGYSLYLKDGVPVFTVRNPDASELYRLRGQTLSAGKHTIIAAVETNGTMILQVDELPAVKLADVGLIARHPQEDLSFGVDDGNPVDPDAASTKFNGTIEAVSIEIISRL